MAVILSRGSERAEFADDRVYFAFPSGTLRYDCAVCGAQCCSGHGYGMSEREFLYQLARHPGLALFMRDEDEADLNILNLPPECFFLTSDGRCQIHQEDGFSAKPETCRLFPFNHIRQLGSYLVVAPHPSLCPLRTTTPGEAHPQSDHRALLKTMAASPLCGHVRRVNPVFHDIDRLIALERAIVTAIEGGGGVSTYPQLMARQLELTRESGLAQSCMAPESPGSISVSQQVEQVLVRFCELLGIERADVDDRDLYVSRVMAVITPALRTWLTMPSSVSSHHACTAYLEPDQVVTALGAVFVLACLARRLGMAKLSFQTVSRLYSDHHSLILMLAHIDVPVRWRDEAEIELDLSAQHPFRSAYLRLARALAAPPRRSSATLANVLLNQLSWDGNDRVRFLRFAAGRLHGRIRPSKPDHNPRTSGRRGSMRRSMKRWLLRTLDDDTLAMVLRAGNRRGRAASTSGEAATGVLQQVSIQSTPR